MTTQCKSQDGARTDESRGRVLLVHSCAATRALVRNTLAGANCDVIEASDGTQAFMMVLAMEIDLAITDLDMKPGTGLDFIAALSILPVQNVCPEVIVWSDLVDEPAMQGQLRHTRVAAKLKQSADIEKLLAAVNAVLDDPLQFVQKS